jgi:hypothetical protein
VIPPHIWIHVIRHGPAGIAAALVYFGTAPLRTVPNLSGKYDHTSGFAFAVPTQHQTVFGSATSWSEGKSVFWAIVAFVVIAGIMHLVTRRSEA